MQLNSGGSLIWLLIFSHTIVQSIAISRVDRYSFIVSNGQEKGEIAHKKDKSLLSGRNIGPCKVFFGSKSSIYNDTEYSAQTKWDEYYKDEKNIDTDLPLAPENEDEEVSDIEEEVDLTKVPMPKEDWMLKRISHGRYFWHRFFATPGEKSIRAARWLKFTHDRLFCNRVVQRTYTEVHPPLQRRNPDGTFRKLSKKDRRREKSRIQTKRTIVGYDNSGEVSNVLILMNYPQERLVKLVERIRLPGLLDLRNFELLRLLRSSVLYLSKPNNFESIMDFLLAFGRLNNDFDGKFKLFMEPKKYPRRRLRPMIYAVIGKLRCDPFPEDLLIPRRAKEPPIREPFPDLSNPNSVLDKFLTTCISLVKYTLANAKYDFDATMDRSFSDIFTDAHEYTTKGSVNRIDLPTKIEFQKNLEKYLKPLPIANEDDANIPDAHIDSSSDSIESPGDQLGDGWNANDIKRMLKCVRRLGLERVETMIIRIKKLHNDIGFTYQDIINIGKKQPQIFKYGNYKQHCLQFYDLDESLTHEMVLNIVKKYPNILTFNIARCIRPKVYYLTRNMRRNVSELLKFPKYLSFSLYDRIIPRHFAAMNKIYKGEYLSVYKYLFHSGFYNGYGQMVTDPKVPDILPQGHEKHMESYTTVNSNINLRELITTNDDKFCEIFNLTYRNLVDAKVSAQKITLPTDIF